MQVFSNNLNETWRQRQMQKNSPFLSAACIFLVWYWGAPRVQYKTWYSRKGTSVFSNIVNKNTAFQSIDSSKNTPMKNIWTDRTHLFSRALTHCVISTLSVQETVLVLLRSLCSDFYCVSQKNICFWFTIIQCWTWNRLYASMCFHRRKRRVSEHNTLTQNIDYSSRSVMTEISKLVQLNLAKLS